MNSEGLSASGNAAPAAAVREGLIPNSKARLKDQFHEVCRFKHVAVRTEESYWQWVVRLVRHFGSKIDPRDLTAEQVGGFLSHLATVGQVAASTQNQALNALLFLYREVLHLDQPIKGFVRVRRPARLPTVLSQVEMRRLLAAVEVEYELPAQMLYGTGMRLMELLRSRIKDVDVGRGQIMVHGGKGDKDRTTTLPELLQPELAKHLQRVKLQHEADLRQGLGAVWLPEGLARSIRRRRGSGPGNGCFRRRALQWIRRVSVTARRIPPDHAATSFEGGYIAAGGACGRPAGGTDQTGHAAHTAAFVCHASAGEGV